MDSEHLGMSASVASGFWKLLWSSLLTIGCVQHDHVGSLVFRSWVNDDFAVVQSPLIENISASSWVYFLAIVPAELP